LISFPLAIWLVQLPVSIWWTRTIGPGQDGRFLSSGVVESALVGLLPAIAVASAVIAYANYLATGRWSGSSFALSVIVAWLAIGITALAVNFIAGGTRSGWVQFAMLVAWVLVAAAQAALGLPRRNVLVPARSAGLGSRV
jgi:hypothetical protein